MTTFEPGSRPAGAVRARAPLRLGLAGGGTDVSPYCDDHGGHVLNATIDLYAYASIVLRRDDRVVFRATDIGQTVELQAAGPLPLDGVLGLHRGVYNRIVRDFRDGRALPVTMTTFSDAPAGSGLGASSTLVVAMVKAFVELLNLPLGEYEIAHLAYEIERIDLGLQGGKQDQYAAAFGGVNFMEFYADDRVLVNPLRVKNWILSELESSLLLYYTGVSRESAAIIGEQSENLRRGRGRTLEAMHALKREAIAMKESVLRGDFGSFIESMNASWQSKREAAAAIANPRIDAIHAAARDAGALAGKVSGAGGGGFMMFFVDPDRRMDVMHRLASFDGRVVNCHFTKLGTQGWRLP
jgi:D-glycero-alpha-D-manno-heptose-7-phosphate kinase